MATATATTMGTTVRVMRWRRAAAAVAVCGMMVASACSGSDEPAAGSGAETTDDAGTVASTVASTVADTDVPSTDPTADGAALLRTAVDGLADSYHFLTVVTAGGGVALQAEGDRVGDGSRFVVMRDDAVVEYIVTPDGTWVKPDGEEWTESDIEATTANPVPVLAAATSVTIESTEEPSAADSTGSTATVVTLVASVPDAALGYVGDGVTEVTVTLLDGAIDQVRYATTVQGLEASLLTRVGPVTDDAPVVAPI